MFSVQLLPLLALILQPLATLAVLGSDLSAPRDDSSIAARENHHRKEFAYTVTWEDYAPDGFSKKMLLVNGQSPGPVMEVKQGDLVVVNVHNRSPFNTTIHFHGIEMYQTPWSDGVPGVTQWAIHPGDSFVYQFHATQYGSYWYHSHLRGQIEDGLMGPIVIHPRKSDPKPFHMISKGTTAVRAMERAVRHVKPLVISDFTHLTSTDKWDMTVAAGIEDSCYDSIIFNGKGRVQCLDKDEVAEHLTDVQKLYLGLVPGATMTDKSCLPAKVMNALGGGSGNESAIYPGVFDGCKPTKGSVEVVPIHKSTCSPETWIAIDVVGSINFITAAVSIDEHDMWVYAMDGSYIEPQKVQALILTNGDRYSVLVKTEKAGDFQIRCNAVSAPQIIVGQAVLRVKDKGSGSGYGDDGESTPYIDIAGTPVSKDVVFFDQNSAHPYPAEPIAQKADALFILNMRLDGASYLWALNSTRLSPNDLDSDSTPILFRPDPNEHNNVTLSTINGTWVDLVFLASTFPMPPHPIHKHGNKMFQIGAGTGAFKWSSVEEAMKDVPGQFNLVNPPRRDAFASPPAIQDQAWVVVRYHVTNPGPWLLHCHISNHMMGGMMMVIQDGIDRWPTVPATYLNY